jgi:formylglycine-generating enzyme required for sulfatase activity
MRHLLALAALLVALPAHAVVMEWVTVGDPGNVGDGANCWNPPCGAVPYRYLIGRYEVTNAQYAEFLNAVAATDTEAHGLYNSDMASGRGGIARSGNPGSYSYSTIPGRERTCRCSTSRSSMRFAS